ncbi:hypothetical protein ES705_08359 [subsurface metagenome]
MQEQKLFLFQFGSSCEKILILLEVEETFTKRVLDCL